MNQKVTIVFLVIGGLLAGCGETVPTISETKDLPKGIPSVPTQTIVTGVTTRSATFAAGDPTQKQDFLFVFDDSGSMTGEVDTVQASLSDFFGALSSRRNIDYRVAVTTSNAWLDQGSLYSATGGQSVLSPSTPGVVSEFSSILNKIKGNIIASQSRAMSGYEMGWLSAELAISNYGAQFMRDGVPLAVVILTDATDISRRCYLNSRGNVTCDSAYPVSRFVDYFKSLKTPSQVPVKSLLYPLAARYGTECSTLEGGEADWTNLGNRYFDVQNQVGTGFFGSICSGGLSGHLSEIGHAISDRGICYDLSGGAKTITDVTVGGAKISASMNGYQFDGSTGSVCFAGTYQPAAGQAIIVNYTITP